MFNKKEFANVLQKISATYSSISEFAEKSEVNRTYLSKYINMKLDNPPTPKILEKIANRSNNIITYAQLMEVCGYIDVSIDIESEQIKQRTEYILENFDYLLSIRHDGKTNL
ncbi:MAG: helix-turn-helix domain-containing protein [Clostridia bacterium]